MKILDLEKKPCFTLWISFWKKRSLYAFKLLNFKLTMPSLVYSNLLLHLIQTKLWNINRLPGTSMFKPASTEKFFSEFWSDFSVCFPLRPLDMRCERKIFLSIPEVWFLDATRFVRLVLTGVRVTNFFIFAIFDLIFLLSVHINI